MTKASQGTSKRAILIASLMLILCIAIGIYYFAFFVIKASYIIPMSGEIGNKVGLTGDRDGLRFGIAPPDGTSVKKLILRNNKAYPLQVIMTPEGNITEFLLMEDNYFYLNASEERTLLFRFQAPKNASFGSYEGRLRIIMKR